MLQFWISRSLSVKGTFWIYPKHSFKSLENCNTCHLDSSANCVPLVSSQRTALCLLLLCWSKPVGSGGSEAIQGHARIWPSTPTIFHRGGPRPWRQEWGCQQIREAQGPREVSWLAEASGTVVWYQLWCSVMFKWAQLKTVFFFSAGPCEIDRMLLAVVGQRKVLRECLCAFALSMTVFVRALLNGRPVPGSGALISDVTAWIILIWMRFQSETVWIRIIPVENCMQCSSMFVFLLNILETDSCEANTGFVPKWPSASSQQMAKLICPTYLNLKQRFSVS